MLSEVRFFDEAVWPQRLHQLFFFNQMSGSLHQEYQCVESLWRQRNRQALAQKTALMSYLGTRLLYGLKRGTVKITTDDAKAAVTPLPANIDTGILVITRANASYFYHR